MDGLLPNLRGHLAGFFEGVIALDELYRWSWNNAAAIEEHGSDEDVALLNLLEALRTDPLVQQELSAQTGASYGM